MMSPEPSAQEASPATDEATESWPGTVAHMCDKNRRASVEVEVASFPLICASAASPSCCSLLYARPRCRDLASPGWIVQSSK